MRLSHLSPIRSSIHRIVPAVIAIIIAGLAETLGIGLLLPILNLFQNPELAVNYSLEIKKYSGIELNLSDITRVLFLGLVLFFLIAGIFQLAPDMLVARLIEGFKSDWQEQVLAKYLVQNYQFHIDSMRGELIQRQMVHTDMAGELVLQICNLLRDIVLAVFVCLMLAIFSPIFMGLLVIFIGPVFYLLLIYARNTISKKAEEAQTCEAKAFSLSSEILDGIKEVWAFGIQKSMSKKFSNLVRDRRDRKIFIRSIQNIPSVFLRTLTLGAFTGVLYYLVVADRGDLIGVLGVFGIGLFRVNGAIARINASLVNIFGRWPSIRIVAEELNRPDSSNDSTVAKIPLVDKITFNHVSFSHPNKRSFAIKDLNLEIERGAIVGIVGPSGSGKSTLLGLLLGFLEPDSGEILLNESDIREYSPTSWLQTIGYTGQEPFVLSGTLLDNITLAETKIIDSEKMEIVKNVANLTSFLDSLPLGLGTTIGEGGLDLSGGQRQRLAIARAIYRDPAIYIFDEATSNLDNNSANLILNNLKEYCKQQKKTLIMVAHKLSLVSDADMILVMEDGFLREKGQHKELMSNKDSLYRKLHEKPNLLGLEEE